MKPIDFNVNDRSDYENFVLENWTNRKRETSENEILQSLFVMGIGLPGETAEVLEHISNYVFEPDLYDEKETLLELGDVYFYLTRISLRKGISEKEILDSTLLATESTSIEQMEDFGISLPNIHLNILKDAMELNKQVGRMAELLKKEVRDNKLDPVIFKETLVQVHDSFNNILKRFDFDLDLIKDLNKQKLIERKLFGKIEKKPKPIGIKP